MHKQGKGSAGKFVLPPELWEEIYKRLVLSDRIRFSSLGLISQKPDGPPPVPESWLLLSHNVLEGHHLCKHRFHCFSDERVYRFGNALPNDCAVLGTSNGWLLTNQVPFAHYFNLVNPILNAEIRIIPQYYSCADRIKKFLVVETRLASGDYTVVVLTTMARLVVYINSKFYDQHLAPPFADIAFYKGKIHGLVIWEGRFEIHVSRLDTVLEQLYVIRGIATRGIDEAYLVESRGDLLIVTRQYETWLRTDGFEVFKLVMANGFADAVKLQSLGDQALFCGSDGCISLAVGQISPFAENHIYFIACPLRWSCQHVGDFTFGQKRYDLFVGGTVEPLFHADQRVQSLFRIGVITSIVEIDLMLRPAGACVYIRDSVSLVSEVEEPASAVEWVPALHDTGEGAPATSACDSLIQCREADIFCCKRGGSLTV